MQITNQDNHGWYEVGPNRYYNKIEAILEHNQARQPIRWNYNDQAYDQYQWDQEPAQSIEDLYAARAWQIRNQYDYVVLHFSGGTDSGNILETFIRNGIHLDEVLIRGSISQTQIQSGCIDSTQQYAECLSQALPLAQWARDNYYPHLKINVHDTTKTIIDYFTNNPDWAEKDLTHLSPGQAFRTQLNTLCPHYVTLALQGKKVVHVVGADKPNLFFEKGMYYTRWLDDEVRVHYVPYQENQELPYYLEMFYWSSSAVELQIKQLHQIKNYLKFKNISLTDLNQLTERERNNFLASILYRRTMPLLTEHRKDLNNKLIKDRDAWFGQYQNNTAFENWSQGVKYLAGAIPLNWQNQGNLLRRGIKGIWSRIRYLGS